MFWRGMIRTCIRDYIYVVDPEGRIQSGRRCLQQEFQRDIQFEHNTPLHDGAVIIRDNRVLAATCYLPLTDRIDLNKALGTRHRAAVGISEVSDSMTIVVSEETGEISIAYGGTLYRNLDAIELRKKLTSLQPVIPEHRRARLRKGGKKNGKK